MKKIFTLFLLLAFFSPSSKAQVWEWVESGGNYHAPTNGNNHVTCNGIARDKFDNIYVTGCFTDTLRFVDTLIVSMNPTGVTRNYFIVKFQSNGVREWIKVYKNVSLGDFPQYSQSAIKICSTGDILFSGCDITEGYFIKKIRQDGSEIWTRKAPIAPYYFTIDNATDEIYVHRSVLSSAPGMFGNQALQPITSYAIGKWDKDGNTLWVKQFPFLSNYLSRIRAAKLELSPSGSELLFSGSTEDAMNIGGIQILSREDHGIMFRLNSSTGDLIKNYMFSDFTEPVHATWASDSIISFTYNDNPFGTGSDSINHLPINHNAPSFAVDYMVLAAIDTGCTTVKWAKVIYTLNTTGNASGSAYLVAYNNNTIYWSGKLHSTSYLDPLVLYNDISLNNPGFVAAFDLETGNLKNYTIGGGTNFDETHFSYMDFATNGSLFIGGHHSSYDQMAGVGLVFGSDTLPILGKNNFFVGSTLKNPNGISGRVYGDFDRDSSFSGHDAPVQNVILKHQPSNLTYSSGLNGYYLATVDSGDYIIQPQINIPPFFEVAPLTRNGNLAGFGQEVLHADFRLVPVSDFKEVAIDITQIDRLRPGAVVRYMINYKNNGPAMASGEYGVAYDYRLRMFGSDSSAVANFPDSAVFRYVNLAPFESRTNMVAFIADTTLTFADTLTLTSIIFPVDGDTLASNNLSRLMSPVFGPFDPNQKIVLPNESILIGDAQAGTQEIEYTLQFQNTGNDTAFNVIVTDSLSALLNVNSLRLISSSHPFKLNLLSNDLLEFRFMNIMLVDSFQNEPKSHGFVKFRIKPFTSVSIIDTVYNNCNIFFDYNSPITTNTVKTFFITPAVPPVEDSVSIINFIASKNNNESLLEWTTGFEQNVNHYSIERSADSVNFLPIGQKPALGSFGGSYLHTDATPVSGKNFYRIKAVFEGGGSSYSAAVMVDHTPVIENSGFHIGPVPAKNHLRVHTGNVQMPARAIAYVYDNIGRLLIKNVTNLNASFYDIDVSHLSSGMYFIKVEIGGKVHERAFIK